MEEKNIIKNFSIEELKQISEKFGQAGYRCEQLFHELYVERKNNFADMSILPKKFRENLSNEYQIDSISDYKTQRSVDGTVKFLFTLLDGKQIESVLIPDEKKGKRLTLCVSSQVGCTLNCIFCATGKLGFQRNLETAEIIDQVLFAEKIEKVKITNIVFMGMGEPLYNLKNVIKAIEILTNPKAEIMGQKRITVSTAVVLKKINELADSGLKVKLAISLHATTDMLRQKLIPYAERVSLTQIGDAVEYYYRKTKQDITYEYIFLAGLNNSTDDVKRLSRITKRVPSKVNIIPYHDISFTGAEEVLNFRTPVKEEIEDFANKLRASGVRVSVRSSSGFDIDGACGQLAYSERQ
ncbi:23S rRNA (adenine(2503)-C(2))-methyltransferase RlmN [Bacteroidota bacterium]